MKFVIAPPPDDPKERKELQERVDLLKQPVSQMKPRDTSVLFLRGIYCRATFVSMAFHSFTAAASAHDGSSAVVGQAGIVFQHYLRHTSFASMTLDCRKAFDDANKAFRGGQFARTSATTLGEHAAYWADQAKVSSEDALAALTFLRQVFEKLARPRKELIKGPSSLEQRVGFLRFHADRSAAHLSLDDYSVHVRDLAHVVAVLVFIGEIIRTFDDPWAGPGRFNNLDAEAVTAAQALFPSGKVLPMFAHMDVAHHARKCWQEPTWGLEYLLNGLPAATGWG